MNLYVSWGKRENHSWAASSSLDPFIQSQSQMNIHFQHDHHKRPLNKTLAMTDRQCWDNMLHIVTHVTEYWTHQIKTNAHTFFIFLKIFEHYFKYMLFFWTLYSSKNYEKYVSCFSQKYEAAQRYSTLIIIICFLSSKSAYQNDFWRSCDTEDWSNDAENSAAHHRNYILK